MKTADLLSENIKEFYTLGKIAFERTAYNSAVSLFFKALAVLADLYILQKEGYIPKSHTERFRFLEEKYPTIYTILDKDFPVYQESYKLKLSKEIAEVLEKDVRRLAESIGFTLA